MNIINRFRLTALILIISAVSYPFSPAKHNNDTETINGDSKELSDSSANDIFDLIFTEAKSFYVDAQVSAYFNDTSDAKYCFDRVFEIIAEISELDSLTDLQQDDFNRFNEKVSNDFQTNFAYLSEDSESFPNVAIAEELFENVIDTVDIGYDTLMVIEDRPGHIAIVRSKKIDKLITYFTGRPASSIQRFLETSNKYRPYILPILKQYGVPEEIFYLPLIESGFNPNAYSYAHAAGMWQFIAGTGARYGLKRNWYVDERRDPIKSTHAAAKYLRKLYDEFDDWYLALAAYNSGEMRIWRAIKREGTRDYWKLHSLPSQTRNYVPTYMAAMIIAKNPEKYGFTSPVTPTWEWDEVIVDRCYEFDDIAKACDITTDVLREYNPELRRWMTPSNDNQYILRVPKGKGLGLIEKLTQLPESEPKDAKPELVSHRVRRGQTLSSIARQYGTSVSALVSANHLRSRNQLRVGQTLMIPTSAYYSTPEKKVAQTNVITHTVKNGDTLSEIAETYNTSISKIRSMNNIYQDNIQPGTKIKIPTNLNAQDIPTGTPKGNSKVVHIVRKGDTLLSIAAKYNVSLSKLKSWNDLNDKRHIYPGQKIVVYKSIRG
ncbi:MAG: LysM peptidoglycan-binding domain-containing protein [Candidatus Neomarinimicrobiota bacterium]